MADTGRPSPSDDTHATGDTPDARGVHDPHHAQDPRDDPRDEAQTARHRRTLLLGEISADGMRGLSHVLRRASAGDRDAAGIPVSSLLKALPDVTALSAYELLRWANVRESDLAGDLGASQRVALLGTVERAEHLRRLLVR